MATDIGWRWKGKGLRLAMVLGYLRWVELYERWRDVLAERAGEVAITEALTGKRWSFSELDDEAARTECSRPLVFARDGTVRFIVDVLAAWRTGAIVVPLEADQPEPVFHTALPANARHIKLTSGSGGAPKNIVFTASQLAADALNIVRTMGLRPDWPNLCAISMAHSYGFSNVTLPLLLHGIPVVLAWSPLPAAVAAAAAHAEHLTIPSVPALWSAWHQAKVIPPNTRLAISAGSPLPLALERDMFSATGVKIHNFYGSSECGGIAYDSSVEPRGHQQIAGRAMENVELSVNGTGCLVVRSKAVGRSMSPDGGLPHDDGEFVTTDHCSLVDGEVRIIGRAGAQMNIAGRKLSPETVEAVIASFPGVSATVVFAVPSEDATRGDDIVACVGCSLGVTISALREHALAALPAWQAPRRWWLTPELKVNARGKLSREFWKTEYLRKRSE